MLLLYVGHKQRIMLHHNYMIEKHKKFQRNYEKFHCLTEMGYLYVF